MVSSDFVIITETTLRRIWTLFQVALKAAPGIGLIMLLGRPWTSAEESLVRCLIDNYCAYIIVCIVQNSIWSPSRSEAVPPAHVATMSSSSTLLHGKKVLIVGGSSGKSTALMLCHPFRTKLMLALLQVLAVLLQRRPFPTELLSLSHLPMRPRSTRRSSYWRRQSRIKMALKLSLDRHLTCAIHLRWPSS